MAEQSSFIKFIGDTPSTRLLDFFITGREFDYSLSDIAKNAGVSWTTLHRIFPNFEKNKMITKTREIGRAKLYRLNQNNASVKKLIELYDSILKQSLEKASETSKLTVMAR